MRRRFFPCSEAGFTLLEMLVVLAISSLLMTAALTYRGQRSVSLRVLGVQLASQLNAARETAIANDQPVAVRIEANGASYRIGAQRRRIDLPKTVRLEYVPTEGLSHAQTHANLEFFADGSSTGGFFKVSDAANSIRLRVELLSGAVTLESPVR